MRLLYLDWMSVVAVADVFFCVFSSEPPRPVDFTF